MAKRKKDKSAKEDKNPFKVQFFAPGIEVLEHAIIQGTVNDNFIISYRRKGSPMRDIETIKADSIIAIINGEGSDGTLVRYKNEIQAIRNIKLSGSVEDHESGLIRLNGEHGTALINPSFCKIIKPDEEVNKKLPKRGRKPTKNKESSSLKEKEKVEKVGKKKKKKKKFVDEGKQRRAVPSDW